MISASRSASAAGLGVVLAHAFEQGACGRGCPQRVGVAGLAGQRLARLLRGGAQRVGVAQPGLVGRQLGVLARLGVDRLDLAEPEPEQVGLPSPLAGAGHDLVELALGRLEPCVQRGVRRHQGQHGLAAEPVQRLSLGPLAQQPVLVGLAVHGHQRLGGVGQPGHRHRGAADPGPRPPFARDVAGQHHAAVLDLAAGVVDRRPEARRGRSRRPRPRPARCPRRCGPCRCRPRPPSSSPSAVTTIVLPAPVSPVMTVSPGPSSSREDSMTPSWPIRISSSISPGLPRRDGGARPSRASPGPGGRTWPPAGR